MDRKAATSVPTPTAETTGMVASLPKVEAEPPAPIRLEVVAPLPPRRPQDDALMRAEPIVLSPIVASALHAPERLVDVAALGTLPLPAGPAAIRPTVLPQMSPPVSEPVVTHSVTPAPRSEGPDSSAPAPPEKDAAPEPLSRRAPTAAPVRMADARPPGMPAETPVFYPRGTDDGSAASERQTRKLSAEWELPRAPRRAGRPALDQKAAPATSPSLPTTRIAYVVRNQPLDQLLRELGQLSGTRIVPGPGVRGAVRERRLEGPANSVIDRIAREFGLFWFSDGGTVYMDPLDEQKTKFFKVRGASAEQVDRTLDAAGLARHRDRIQYVGADGLVRASGPDNFLRVVEAALTGMEVDRGTVNVIKFGQRTQ